MRAQTINNKPALANYITPVVTKQYLGNDIISPKEKNNSIFASLICNVLLLICKGITGILANSNALVTDT